MFRILENLTTTGLQNIVLSLDMWAGRKYHNKNHYYSIFMQILPVAIGGGVGLLVVLFVVVSLVILCGCLYQRRNRPK